MSRSKAMIIWAIDPFKTEKNLLTKSVIYLEKLARDLGAVVKPTYILSPYMFFLPMDYFIPPDELDFVQKAQAKLDEALKQFKSAYFLPGIVLTDNSNSLRGSVDTFIANAKDEKATCIFATTHARRGLPRFWLGSFVETLLMHSPVPVISLNPNTKSATSITSILFPTDLSIRSVKSLLKVLPMAKKLGSKLYVLHVFGNTQANWASVELSGITYDYYDGMLDKMKSDSKTRLDKLVKRCQKSGVTCEGIFVITTKSITDEILRVAKTKKIKLVAMASISGPVENMLTGGITRQVVRYGDCATWVVH
ncbi:MAG: hypothetical protein A4S09_03810 [Proteobacteria bacterium SG_bin7]|nr:MAG: hypothetical protein A4S09_03810 [Proteobacteria bacterium SG_bin7]